MPVAAIDATPGSATANSYVTLAEADQFNLNRPNTSTWTAASTNDKTSAILWATILMDALWRWNGYPVDAIQALLWPRGAMLKRNGWEYVSLTVIPQELKNATAEYARQLLESNRTSDSDIETLGITSVAAGPVRLTFKDSVVAKTVPDAVYNLIPENWGFISSRGIGVRDTART